MDKIVISSRIQTFWNHKEHWLRSISAKVTKKIDDIQCVQWRPVDTMQRIRRSMESQEIRTQYTILSLLERLWKQTWLIDSRNSVTTCQESNSRLLGTLLKL